MVAWYKYRWLDLTNDLSNKTFRHFRCTLPSMKLISSTVILAIDLATRTNAAPQSFDYGGVVTKKGGIKCSGYIHYTVVDDAGGDDREGNFDLDGCLGGSESFDDGTFTLDIDRDERTAVLTEISSGLVLEGTQGEHQGPVKPCTANSCPPPTTMRCIFGAGPEGTEPSTTDCGLT